MPSTGPRVVCALWVTMATLAPTSALISVDLPLFGAPIRATKPHRLTASRSLGSGLSSSCGACQTALAHQHGERRRLLGRALVRAVPALRRDAVDLHLGGKARRVIRPLAGDFEIDAAAASAVPCAHSCSTDLASGAARSKPLKLRRPKAMHDVPRRLHSRHR